MVGSAWKNGSAKSDSTTYGIRSQELRKFIDKRIGSKFTGKISLYFKETEELSELNITDSFWNKCPEIRGKVIKKYFNSIDQLIWPKGHPYKYILSHRGGTLFEVKKASVF